MTIGTSVERALEVLAGGGLVAIPTETVYGLAADAGNQSAVRRIFAAKDRPADHPLIVHVAAAEHLAAWTTDIPPAAARLAETCWPGPLTLLLHKAPHVLPVVTGGRDTIGVRVPAHPMTTELLGRFGGGLAAPSANRFGKVSPTTAQHVAADLGDRVDYILDGGPCPVGVESTIIDCTTNPPQVLRPGGITNEVVEALLDAPLAASSGPERAPGMLASHYAPSARVLLADTSDDARRLAESYDNAWVLDRSDDLVAYARLLYADLHDADDRRVAVVVAVMPPASGLGHAIRDRLRKAAASAA